MATILTIYYYVIGKINYLNQEKLYKILKKDQEVLIKDTILEINHNKIIINNLPTIPQHSSLKWVKKIILRRQFVWYESKYGKQHENA